MVARWGAVSAGMKSWPSWIGGVVVMVMLEGEMKVLWYQGVMVVAVWWEKSAEVRVEWWCSLLAKAINDPEVETNAMLNRGRARGRRRV